jgi:hypothetical protein
MIHFLGQRGITFLNIRAAFERPQTIIAAMLKHPACSMMAQIGNIRFAREGRTARRQTQASPECRAPLLERSRLSAHRPKRRFGARLKPDRTIPGPRLRA